MNGTNKELVGVYNNCTPISSILNGTKIVWQKTTIPDIPVNPYKGKLAGKFSSSTSYSDCIYYKGGTTNSSNKVTLPVNANKEFAVDVDFSGTIRDLFFERTTLEAIYNIPITNKVTNTREVFYYCTNLTSIHCDDWDLSNVTDASNMFDYCYKLTDVTGSITGIKVALKLSHCTLTNESAMIFINGLEPTTVAKTITFKTATYNTLTDEQKAIATTKGWTIAKA